MRPSSPLIKLLALKTEANGKTSYVFARVQQRQPAAPERLLADGETITVGLGEEGLAAMSHADLVTVFAQSCMTRANLARMPHGDSPLVRGCDQCRSRNAEHYKMMQHPAATSFNVWHCVDCQVNGFVDSKRRAAMPPGSSVTIMGTSRADLNGRQAFVLQPSSSAETSSLTTSGRLQVRVGAASASAAMSQQQTLSLSFRNVVPTAEAPPAPSPVLTAPALFATDALRCCETEARGYGVFAARRIEAGTLLLKEAPIVIVDMWLPHDATIGPLLAAVTSAATREEGAEGAADGEGALPSALRTESLDAIAQRAAQLAVEQLPAEQQRRVFALADAFATRSEDGS